MRQAELSGLLRRVRRGDVAPAVAARRILRDPLERLGFATLDHERSLRAGFPEVVFGPGKTPQQLVTIMGRLFHRNGVVLATRVSPEGREAVPRSTSARVPSCCGAAAAAGAAACSWCARAPPTCPWPRRRW